MDYAHSATDKMLYALEHRIRAEYSTAVREAEAAMQDYLRHFEKNDSIMVAKLHAGDINLKQYKDWRMKQMMLTRKWETTRAELADIYVNADKVAAELILDTSSRAYALNHNYGTFEAEKGAGLDTSYTLYSKDTVSRLLKDNPDLLPPVGKNTAERIASGEIRRWNMREVQSVMTQGILQGKSIPKIAKDLAKTVGDRNMHSAVRDARTMMTSAQSAGRLDSYRRAESMGIKMGKQWMATHDGRTRHSHRDIDGELVPVEALFSNGLRFPADPYGAPAEVYNCRCTMVGEVLGVDDVDLAEWSDTDIDFEEWLEEHE